MAKLYPPILGASLPATQKTNTGIILKIPFELSRAVSKNEITGFSLRIQTLQGYELGIIKQENITLFSNFLTITIDSSSNSALYNKLKIKNYYKVLLAFISDEIGYYSQPAIVKITDKIQIGVEELENSNHLLSNTLTGYYKHDDITEKEYSYRFVLKKQDTNEIIFDSGVLLHNTETDTESNISYDTYILNSTLLNVGTQYYLDYTVTTINGLTISRTYEILGMAAPTSDYDEQLKIDLEPDEINGCIKVYLTFLENEKAPNLNGYFEILRCSEKDDYLLWETLAQKVFYNEHPFNKKLAHIDFTLEHGIKYKYAIRQYNKYGIVSKPIEDNTIVSLNFEDMFLYDGERQLRIAYNPKVTSYKTTILQSKTDTIGNKYPFFFRNGTVAYKELPIQGLISYWMDEDEYFMSWEDLGLVEDNDTLNKDKVRNHQAENYTKETKNLTEANMFAERVFKNSVNDFLNNGKPKLFRSSAEGNYIVYIMNVNMTPEDKLSRMLHSFTCSAYEVADANKLESLKNYNILKTINNGNIESGLSTSYTLSPTDWPSANANILQNNELVYSLRVTDAAPGQEVTISAIDEQNNTSSETYVIGATGTLTIIPKDKTYINSISVLQKQSNFLSININYYLQNIVSDFDKVKAIEGKTLINKEITYELIADLLAEKDKVSIRDIIKYLAGEDGLDENNIYLYAYGYRTSNKEGHSLKINNTLYTSAPLLEPQKYLTKAENDDTVDNILIKFVQSDSNDNADIAFIFSAYYQKTIIEE